MDKQLAVIEITPELAPTIYVAGGLSKFFEQIKAQVVGEIPDLTTKKGRDRVASLAAQVSRSKTAVEKPGRDYLRHIKEQPKAIEKELREWVDRCDALRDEVRAPLTAYEQKEAARVAELVDGISAIRHLGDAPAMNPAATAEQITEWLRAVEQTQCDDRWQEMQSEAIICRDTALQKLKAALLARQEYEAQQAELERLRQEQAQREQQERERQIADQAAAAERQRQEQARIDADRARVDAEQKAEQAKRDAELAERRRIEQEAKAKADAEQAKIQAEIDAKAAADLAIQQERQRIDNDRLAKQQQDDLRAKNLEHQGAVNYGACVALQSTCGVDEQLAKAIVKAIIRGQIPGVSISY